MLALATLAVKRLPDDLRRIVIDWEKRVSLAPKPL